MSNSKKAAANNNKRVAEPKIRHGAIKFYDIRKGYGFITDDETGEEVFVHFSGLNNPKTYYGLNPGDQVSFVTSKDRNNKVQAVAVTCADGVDTEAEEESEAVEESEEVEATEDAE